MCIIIVFAHPTIRKKAYNFFWSTHCLYVVLYVLCLMHGLARLTGAPRFWLFLIGPGITFILDKVIFYYFFFVSHSVTLFSGCKFENTSHSTGCHRDGIIAFRCNQDQVLSSAKLKVFIWAVGASGMHCFQNKRISFVHVNVCTA